MDEQPNTPDTAAPVADQAIENWIAAGRQVVEQHLVPLERLANSGSPFAHEFAVAKNAFAAALHSVLSHVAHEDHPGVIAEAAKLAEAPVEDAVEAVSEALSGDTAGAVGSSEQAVGAAVAGAAQVAADLATGTPLVSAEDVASVEAAVVEGIAGAASAAVVGSIADPAADVAKPEAEPTAADLLS